MVARRIRAGVGEVVDDPGIVLDQSQRSGISGPKGHRMDKTGGPGSVGGSQVGSVSKVGSQLLGRLSPLSSDEPNSGPLSTWSRPRTQRGEFSMVHQS